MTVAQAVEKILAREIVAMGYMWPEGNRVLFVVDRDGIREVVQGSLVEVMEAMPKEKLCLFYDACDRSIV